MRRTIPTAMRNALRANPSAYKAVTGNRPGQHPTGIKVASDPAMQSADYRKPTCLDQWKEPKT